MLEIMGGLDYDRFVQEKAATEYSYVEYLLKEATFDTNVFQYFCWNNL